MTTLWVQLFTRWIQQKYHWVTWLALVMWLVLHCIGPEWDSSPRPGLTTTPPPAPAPHHAVSLLVRPIACVAHMSDAWVSYPGGEGQTSSSESQAGTKPKSTPFPPSQSLSHWNTFCRCLLLSPNQALGVALLNSEPGFYLILKIWKP